MEFHAVDENVIGADIPGPIRKICRRFGFFTACLMQLNELLGGLADIIVVQSTFNNKFARGIERHRASELADAFGKNIHGFKQFAVLLLGQEMESNEIGPL